MLALQAFDEQCSSKIFDFVKNKSHFPNHGSKKIGTGLVNIVNSQQNHSSLVRLAVLVILSAASPP
ncbi:MAG: hypothetical protein IJM09_02930 [Neisseriaceae bacterium]|nr:hypothetical protein [Neisseriaceae bacterium]